MTSKNAYSSSNNTLPEYPKEAYCSITMDVMKDPVSGNEGEVFERSAVEEWVREHHCSPLTRQPLEVHQLRSCLPLKSMIEDITEKRNEILARRNAFSPKSGDKKANPFPHVEPIAKAEIVDTLMKCSIEYPDEPLEKTKTTRSSVVVANLDVSGSMDGPSSRNNVEGANFSTLALAKHSIITIIKGLDEQSQFALVTFSSTSKQKFPPTFMTEVMKKKAIAAVNLVCTEGNTNYIQELNDHMM